MIDTIALNIPEKDFKIKNPERFNPNAAAILNPVFSNGGLVKAVYNPTKAEKSRGYKPRLTLFKKPYTERARAIWLKIEFSAPKLIFGNNFEELRGSEDDLETLLQRLLMALESMGIETTHESLLNARVSAIHYSKNILLEHTTPCYLLIQALEKLDLSGKLDLTQTDFRNGGQMVKYHSSLYEIALYDKVKDLEQATKYGKKRGIEIDYGETDGLFENQRKPEVLRFEVRLTCRKIKSLFRTLKFNQNCVLEELFDGNLSRAVLMHYWQIITDGLYVMNIDVNNIEHLIHSAHKAFPRKQPAKILELIGFIMTSQKLGIRGARLALGLKNYQWYRLKADIKILDKYVSCPRFAVLANIKQQLREFIPLTRNDLAL